MDSFEVNAKGVTVDHCNERGCVALSFSAELEALLHASHIGEVISFFGKEELLDAIGADFTKDHFGLVDDES